MLRTHKTIVAAIAGTVAVIVLYNFAVAEDPTTGRTEPQAPQQAEVKSPIPGWVQKEIRIHMPVLVPRGLAAGPSEDIVLGPPSIPLIPPPFDPSAGPPVPDWVKRGMPVPPGFAPFPAAQFAPEKADPGSLKVRQRKLRDNLGRQYLMRERTWTTGGIAHRELTILDPPPAQLQPPVPPSEPAPAVTPKAAPQQQQQQQATPAPSADRNASQPQTAAASQRRASPSLEPLPATQAVGIGVSTDSSGQTRIYRYYSAPANNGTNQPADRPANR